MECKNKENKMKFKSKDLILIGIFTVLLYIMSLLVAFVAVVPVGTIVSGAVYALLAAPIYMLYISKIKKPFAITITGVLCSLMGLMSFIKVSITIITLLRFVVADIIAGTKNTKAINGTRFRTWYFLYGHLAYKVPIGICKILW